SGVPQVSPRPVTPFSSTSSTTVRSVFWITYIEPACTMVSGIDTRVRRIAATPGVVIDRCLALPLDGAERGFAGPVHSNSRAVRYRKPGRNVRTDDDSRVLSLQSRRQRGAILQFPRMRVRREQGDGQVEGGGDGSDGLHH